MIQRAAAVLLTIGLFGLSAPMAARACAPYTVLADEDGFGLANGIQWAFVGDVIEEVANPEIDGNPMAVVVKVRERFVGSVRLTRLRIDQDSGCDKFWYQKGDRVIAAIGHAPGFRPPFTGITNYGVAVWVIRDGKVDARVREISIAGRFPATETQLRAMLRSLPDTATIGQPTIRTQESSRVLLVGVIGILAAMIALHDISRRPRFPT